MKEAPITLFVAERPDAEVSRTLRRLSRLPDVVRLAVMPDVHLAGDFCIGVCLATTRTIYPEAVGGDIGCGVATARLDVEAERLREPGVGERLLEALRLAVPVQRHGAGSGSGLPRELAERPVPACVSAREARAQFVTLGRGNHFLEFQADEDGRLWVAVHSGSRAAGQAIVRWHADGDRRAQGLDVESERGRDYLTAMEWARAYADLSRHAMIAAAAGALSRVLRRDLEPLDLFACDHNHVRQERHGDRELWVHRKGALAADASVPGVIPGSMASTTYHVTGRGAAEGLRSSSHGAGRCMARSVARRRISPAQFDRQMRGVLFDRRAAPRLLDEAPGAYKDITRVMRAQRKLTRIVRRLEPVLSYKGC